MTTAKGNVFVISAASGTGKTTLVSRLTAHNPNIRVSVSHTTRAPRENEQHGKHYYFTTREHFTELVGQGAFLEHAEVFGNLYGTSAAAVQEMCAQGLDVILEITQDGRIAKQLIGDNSNSEKEYLVRVKGSLKENGLALLNHGLSLDGEKLRPAQVSWQNQDQLRFVLKQGKKRQIRRMCELVGLRVVGLKRIRVGRIKLGALPQGKWRYLQVNERF